MLKAIILDMDGVLINSHDAWFVMFNKALSHFENKTITKKEFDEKAWAKNFHETSRNYFKVPMKDILDYFNTIEKIFIDNVMEFSDTKSALKDLRKKGLKLTVATNTHSFLAKEILKKVGLINFFNFIVCGDDVKNGKPEPDMLFKTLKELKISKNEAIFIGDTIWDKIAAENAGIRFIGFGIDGDKRIGKLEELKEKI
jgi:HAD superfamily hydrolase (TIGR01549 family)